MKIQPLQNLSLSALTVILERIFLTVQQEYSIFVTTQDFILTPTDTIETVQADAAATAVSITLPSPTGTRRRRIIKTDASANAVTVVGSINGAASVVLAAQYDFVWVEPTGTGWLIIGS